MPCIAPYPDWTPCPAAPVTGVGGVDVSAQNLCLFHYEQRYGQSAAVIPAKADPTVSLLLHGDSLSDEKGHSLTVFGDAKVDSAQSKFGGSSFAFDGTGDYIAVADAPDLWLGSGEYTIEFWARWAAISDAVLLSHGWYSASPPGQSWYIRYNGSLLFQVVSEDGSFAYFGNMVAFTPVVGTWYHIAVVREAPSPITGVTGWRKYYVNGSLIGQTAQQAGTLFDTSYPLLVGALSAGGYFFNGNLDEIRITKAALWRANFTPPSAPYN